MSGLLACGGGGGDGPPAPAKVATVTVTSLAPQIEVGATIQMSFSAVDSKGNTLSGRTATWTSSSPTVASVDGSGGIVTGVAAGTASITATVEGVAGSASITVIPTPVSAVSISPRTPAIKQGETIQLAAVALDAAGRTLSGRPITWSSNSVAIASVSNAGVATGVSSGTAFIVASAEGKRDSVSLRVRSLQAPTVSTSTPSVLTPGITATVTGTNFSAVAAENEVLINGTRAAIVSAAATTIQYTVPSATALPCSPTGPVPLAVVVNGDTATGSATLQMATARSLAVGQHLLLTTPNELACNEFPNTGGRYLVTGFNGAASSATRTSFRLIGASSSQSGEPSVMAALPPASNPSVGPLARPLEAFNNDRFARGHLAVLEENARFGARARGLRTRLHERRVEARAGSPRVSSVAREAFAPTTTAARTPPVAPPNVGDRLWRRMRRTFNDANTFDSVRMRVVYSGPHLVILEDTTNEFAGTMDAEFQSVGAEFDRDMWGFLSNFGDPLAVDSLTDNNQRVFAVFTKRVNEYQPSGGGSLLGFVTLCDFFPQTDPDPTNACPTSNEGEYFYAIAPNPNGVRGKYDLATWKRYARGTMIHELKHVVMFATRLVLDANVLEEVWLEESTAQTAAELWSRKLYGSFASKSDIKWADGPRCDYATPSASCADPVEAILHPFTFLYTHYSNSETRTFINNSDAVIYGSGWSFARWITDTYDGGNERNFLRSLVQQRDDRGVTNVVNRTGRTWAELVGLFSMASVADNYPNATIADARLKLQSWNTRDVFAGMSQNLIFRNPDGSTTPAFPLLWPMRVRTPAFGNFPDAVQLASSVPGGGWVAWDISGTQTAPQVLAIRSLNGTLAPNGIGMVVLRVQ